MIAKLERITADVLEQPVAELAEAVKTAEAANIDETGWRESGRKAWLWVVVTSAGDRLPHRPIAGRGGRRGPARRGAQADRHQRPLPRVRVDQAQVETNLLGPSPPRLPGDDRPRWRRCRGRAAVALAVEQAVRVLAQGPRRHHPTVDLPPVPWPGCGRWSGRAWSAGRGAPAPKTAATCGELLRLWDCLWTFTRVEGVEPTNNAAERALRHAVIWRRISGGTDSEGGSRFVERMLSVVATCRQQRRPVLDYLTRCHRARLNGQPIPSLLAGPPPPAASAA